jgi:hypothetical protein
MIDRLKSALVKWALVGGATLIAAVGFYVKGRADGQTLCDAAAVRTELAAAKADLALAKAANAAAAAASERMANERQSDLEKIDAFEQALSGRDACSLSDDDARRLRDILAPDRPPAARNP